jgi:hypothetical protein
MSHPETEMNARRAGIYTRPKGNGQNIMTTGCHTLSVLFKGIVQRNLTGVETRLKKSALLSHYTAQVPFLILKGHHCERSIKPVSAS